LGCEFTTGAFGIRVTELSLQVTCHIKDRTKPSQLSLWDP